MPDSTEPAAASPADPSAREPVLDVVPDPQLGDEAIALRPFRPEDAARIAEICRDTEIPRWIPLIPRGYTVEHAAGYVAMNERNWRERTSFEFAIVDRPSGGLIGSIGLHVDDAPHRGAIGYWVAPEARGAGVATRAVRLVSRWGFDRFGLGRISVWTLPGNRASQRVAEKAGFRYEGILRSWDRDPEGTADVVMFGLTRDGLADADAADAEAAARAAADEAPANGPRIAITPPELRAPGTRPAPYVDVAAVADLPAGSMRRVTLAGLDLLVAHTPEGIVVTDDRCPHMSAPLSIGELNGCVVACPLHEGRFDLCSGETVRMPTTGGLDADGTYHAAWSPAGATAKAEPPPKKLEARRLTRVRRLQYYPARIRDGRLETQLPIVPE